MIGIRTLLCAASAACGLALGINASATTFTFDLPCDSLTPNGNGGFTCTNGGGTGPTASCSLSPLSPSVAIGTDKVLTMSCSNMAGPVTYAWTGCTSKSGNTCTVNLPTVSSVPVSVTAADGTNNISKGTTVTSFDPNAGGGGGGNVPTACADGTKVVSTTINAFDGQAVSLNLGSGSSQTGIFKVVVPAGLVGPAGGVPNVSLTFLRSGGTSDATSAVAYVSKTACDMPSQRLAFNTYPSQQWLTGYSSATLHGVIDGQSSIIRGMPLGDVLHMTPGDVWYLMFQNKDSRGRDTCKSGTCAVVIKPNVDR